MSTLKPTTFLRMGTLLVIFLIGCSETGTLNSQIKPKTTLGSTAITLEVMLWKNAARSSYSIIFDDFCSDSVSGIQDQADSLASNRGVPIGFGIITNQCDDQEWKRAREMITKGNEAIDHNHRCGQFFESWCIDLWGLADFPIEIDQSTNLIATNTGIIPTFFIFPFDLSTDTMRTYLSESGYYSSRTGQKMQINDAHFENPFDFKFEVPPPLKDKKNSRKYTLNQLIDSTIEVQGYGIREVHGLNDSSWGVFSSTELRNHFDYAAQSIASADLWVGTPSDVIAYRYARENCSFQVITNLKDYSLNFDANPLCEKYPTELTFAITAELGELIVWQNNSVLLQKQHPHDISKIIVDIRTNQGEVKLAFNAEDE